MFKINVLKFITPHVYAGEYYLLEAMVNNLTDVVVDLLVATACGSASYVRDDAVRAEVVAAVVNLYQASGVERVECRAVAEKVFVKALWVNGFAFHEAVDNVEKRVFSLVVDGEVDDAGCEHLLLAVVHHAARRRDDGGGVGTAYLIQRLSAFLVALVRHRTGVHDINVGIVFILNDFVSRRLEL